MMSQSHLLVRPAQLQDAPDMVVMSLRESGTLSPNEVWTKEVTVWLVKTRRSERLQREGTTHPATTSCRVAAACPSWCAGRDQGF